MSETLRCEEVLREISNYIDGVVTASLRRRMERHLAGCNPCTAILDGTRNVVKLAGDPRAFPMPEGASERLRSRLDQHLELIPLGICGG